MDQFQQTYLEEAEDLLQELETALLELENDPGDADTVGRAFRAMHTLKGSGAMFGFDEVAAFTHQLESVFELVRSGQIPATKELVGIALRSKDHIRALIEGNGDPEEERQLVDGLRGFVEPLVPDVEPSEDEAVVRKAEPPEPEVPTTTFRIRWRPGAGIMATGTNPLLLIDELRELGDCAVVARTEDIPPLNQLDAESCYVAWDVVLTTEKGENAIRDVFIFVEDDSEISIEAVDFPDEAEDDLDYKYIGEILVERGDLSREELHRALADQEKASAPAEGKGPAEPRPRLGDILTNKGVVTPGAVDAAVAEQKVVRESRRKAESSKATQSLRVPADKLDSLVDLVGELVIAQARLSQIATRNDDADLSTIAEDVERLTAELRDNTLNIRMLPIGTTFARFRRLVRDLSGDLSKEVELITEGAETELDKTVLDALADPLVHLIRNSIDHGVENPDEREAAGKPRKGTVKLIARHSEAKVVIRIEDDGAGMDPERIRAKGIERGAISPEDKLTDKDLFNLIFAAGFSTAKQVSNVSGRGVGMDVVRRSIEGLRGTVDVDSELGKGTIVTIRLPLTLAIIEGLLVSVDDESFVMPLAMVEECVELERADGDSGRGSMAKVRGQLVPYVRLRELFDLPDDRPTIEQIVIANIENEPFGFVVDHVVGQHQTVIKSLGTVYRDVDGLSGATILGDGDVALILDLPSIVSTATRA